MKKIPYVQEAPIPFTKDGYEKILEEKANLLKERPEAVEHLRKARDMGDLRENGYYKASRARLSFLDARLRRVERLIRLAKIVTASTNDTVQIGSIVKVHHQGKDVVYTVVGGYESDPTQQTISHLSPIGKALMGKRVGQVVTVTVPKGEISLRIVEIRI